MSYTRLTWVESETPLSAQNMNNIEDGIEELQAQKVDKTTGKGLSTNDYTTDEKTKLAGIAAGAQVNVQADWSQATTTADDYIKNKPGNATTSAAGLMSAADKTKLNGIAAGAEVNRTYTAVTGKPTAAASPAFGGTVTVSQVSQNANGQVSVTDRVITFPGSDATTSAHGLMSAADKTKLNKYGSAPSECFSITTSSVTYKINASLYAEGTKQITNSGYYPLMVGNFRNESGIFGRIERLNFTAKNSGSCTVAYRISADQTSPDNTLHFDVLWVKNS